MSHISRAGGLSPQPFAHPYNAPVVGAAVPWDTTE
jgi:hypothetical protein